MQLEHPCPKCGLQLPLTLRLDTQHYGSIRCPQHGFIWIPKPQEVKKQRRKTNTGLINELPERRRNFCWACLRNRTLLSSLRPSIAIEVHHVIPVSEGGTDDPDNLLVLCGECHAEIHRRRESFNRYRPYTSDAA